MFKIFSSLYSNWVILLYLVHTGYLQFLASFQNLAGNEHGCMLAQN